MCFYFASSWQQLRSWYLSQASLYDEKQSRSSSGTDATRELEEEPRKLGNALEPGGQKGLSPRQHTPPFLLPLPVDFLLFQSGEFLHAAKKQATLDSIAKFLRVDFGERHSVVLLAFGPQSWANPLAGHPSRTCVH